MREIKKRKYNDKPNSTSFKKGHSGFRGTNNGMWRGDSAGYTTKHERIYVRFGQPKKCEYCGTEIAKKYEWANISGEYKETRDDWVRLCTCCHRKFDGHAFKMWQTRRNNETSSLSSLGRTQ